MEYDGKNKGDKREGTSEIFMNGKIKLGSISSQSSGLEIVLSTEKSLETLKSMKGNLEIKQKDRESDAYEIKKLFLEHTNNLQRYDDSSSDNLYKNLSKVPIIGNYFKNKRNEKSGNVVQRLTLSTEQKLKRVENFLYKLNQDYEASKKKIGKLTEMKKSAAEEWEKYRNKEDEYTNEVISLQEQYVKLTPRERLSKDGIELETRLLNYHQKMQDLSTDVIKVESVIKNSSDMIAAYMTDVKAISNLIRSNSSLYNNQSFNVSNLKDMNLNITETKKGLEDIANVNSSYDTLSLAANEALLAKSEFAKLDALMVESVTSSFFDGEIVQTAATNLADAANLLNKTLDKRREQVINIMYGSAQK